MLNSYLRGYHLFSYAFQRIRKERLTWSFRDRQMFRFSSPLLTESRLIFFSLEYLDVSVPLVFLVCLCLLTQKGGRLCYPAKHIFLFYKTTLKCAFCLIKAKGACRGFYLRRFTSYNLTILCDFSFF